MALYLDSWEHKRKKEKKGKTTKEMSKICILYVHHYKISNNKLHKR